MEFSEVIKLRQSIRRYSMKDMEEEKIDYILDCARQAPSWANQQCWRFIVIREADTIKELAKTTIVNRWLRKTPCMIVACADTSASGTKNDIEYYLVDVAIALEHLVLAATDVGLGSCWIAGFDEAKVKTILGIPNRIKVVAMTPIGYPAGAEGIIGKTAKTVTQSAKRKSLLEIVRYEKW